LAAPLMAMQAAMAAAVPPLMDAASLQVVAGAAANRAGAMPNCSRDIATIDSCISVSSTSHALCHQESML
jgi:hypothetical protein